MIKAAKLHADGIMIDSVIDALEEPADEKEVRIPVRCEDFAGYGDRILSELADYVRETEGMTLAEPNYEGVRIEFPDGWCLLRKSLHDPILPMNIASDQPEGCSSILEIMAAFLSEYDDLDLSVIR